MWISSDRWSSLTPVVLARRARLRLRLMVAVLSALAFQGLTGLVVAVLWVVAFGALQLAERVAFRDVAATTVLSRGRSIGFLLLVLASATAFSSYGVVLALTGLTGVLGAALLWSVAIIAGMLTTRHSRLALAAAVTPPAFLYAAMPPVVLANGGALSEALAIVAAELVTAAAAISFWFIARRRQLARAVETGATRDPETGLPDSIAAQRRVEALAKLSGTEKVFAAAISIDRFEQVHGAIGHELSIDLVRELASRVSATVFGADVARLSPRVIGLIFTACSADEAKGAIRRLQQAMRAPVVLSGHTVDVSVTIGLACDRPDEPDGAPPVSTIDRAMIAVASAQAAGNSLAFFDASRYGDPARNLSLMSEMLQALDNGQMSVAYQPKYHLESGAIVGAEALVRWMHPERGPLAPDAFVPLAEETGHIGAMTLWVLQRAIEDQRRLEALGHDIPIALNLSGRLIDDADFTTTALRLASGAMGKLIFEVTETTIIGNPSVARQTLEAFRAAGVGISIDDYGAGFSSLSYLKTIPADELKIDRSFVMPMAGSHTDFMLVRSAIELGHSLGLRVVAEGVESEGVLEMLARMHCDVAQGYLISRPIGFGSLVTFLDQRRLPPTVPFRSGRTQRAVA